MEDNNIQIGWLPENLTQETQMADALCEYASRPTSITLHPFAFAKKISVKDFESLADLPEDGQQVILPNAAYICLNLLEARTKDIGGFCEMYWQGKDGLYWKELHIFDEITGITCQRFLEPIC